MVYRRKVLVIGLDGMTSLSLHSFVNGGHMPRVSSLIDAGHEGTLMSTMPPVTGPAWASFFTGRNPGSHGILDFFTTTGDGRSRRLINSRALRGRTLWDLLNAAGRSQVVVNTPLTYPPTAVNGAMITGMLTPESKKELTWPTDLYERLEPDLGEYVITVNWQDYSDRSALRFLDDLCHCNSQRTRYILRLMDEHDADFTMATFTGTDRIHHALWHYVDPAIRSNLGDRFDPDVAEGIVRYFRQLDWNIGKIVEKAGDEAAVFLVSDHGFGPLDCKVYVNNWLENQGLLKIRHNRLKVYRTAMAAARLISRISKTLRLGRRGQPKRKRFRPTGEHFRPTGERSRPEAKQRAALANLTFYHVFYNSIDWSRTRAYMASNSEQGIYVNLKGREPFGIVDPSEYDEVCHEVHQALRSLRDRSGRPLLTRFHRRDEVYTGPFTDRAPDVIFALDEGAALAEINLGGREIFRDTSWKTGSGNHRMEGYFLARGKGFEQGSGLTASIMDVMPTILYYLGIPVPSDLDGQMIKEIFSSAFLEREEPLFAGSAPSGVGILDGNGSAHGSACGSAHGSACGSAHGSACDEVFTRTEEAELQDRLRRLGYMD